jgi:hypothetical protein
LGDEGLTAAVAVAVTDRRSHISLRIAVSIASTVTALTARGRVIIGLRRWGVIGLRRVVVTALDRGRIVQAVAGVGPVAGVQAAMS